MQVLKAIEAKVKELLEQKSNNQSFASKLAQDLEIAKSTIHKIDGALEAFAATNSSLKAELGIVDVVAEVVDKASDVVNAIETTDSNSVKTSDT